jgi:undecaprenyl diphosphate synthase
MKNKNIPNHVVILMDGNRRWAKKRGLPTIAGHKKVVEERIEELIEAAAEIGVEHITFWAFSTENWGRAQDEVGGIMKLFRWAMEKKAKKLIQKGARVKMIGNLKAFDKDIQTGFNKLMQASQKNDKITVIFALNYGGRDEIVRAVNTIIDQNKNSIDEEDISHHLDTKDIPDPDFIIRTSGEQRLSGFMPWQSTYAELYFPATLMPDFGEEEFNLAIQEYSTRKRRYGKG